MTEPFRVAEPDEQLANGEIAYVLDRGRRRKPVGEEFGELVLREQIAVQEHHTERARPRAGALALALRDYFEEAVDDLFARLFHDIPRMAIHGRSDCGDRSHVP